MDEQMSLDLLSDLPLETIHNILSFVPIEEAIRTSALSRQWRYIWTSLPILVFDFKLVNPPMKDESEINRLFRFISQVLLLHEGPIHKLEFRFPFIAVSEVQFQCFDQRLLFSFSNDIRILVLEFQYNNPWSEVSSSLYSCTKLGHLELKVNTIPPPPPFFKGFLSLRSLNIRSPNVDSSTIESIVADSPLLEKLLLFGKQHSKMTIRAPNLKFLFFVYDSAHLSLCTPLLEELILFSEYMKHLSFHESLVFNHLRIIKLYGVRLERTEETMAVNRLIKCSPNLQKFEISTFPFDTSELASASLWDTEFALDFTYDSLKEIKMSILGSGIFAMKLAKFLLARSPALERMIYKPLKPLSEQVLLNIEAELLSCSRASANAEIVIHQS